MEFNEGNGGRNPINIDENTRDLLDNRKRCMLILNDAIEIRFNVEKKINETEEEIKIIDTKLEKFRKVNEAKKIKPETLALEAVEDIMHIGEKCTNTELQNEYFSHLKNVIEGILINNHENDE